MKAILFEQFGGQLHHTTVPDPQLPKGGVIVEVAAAGLCRSDWHGWMGHDDDVVLPHVPGHEFSGTIVEVDSEVTKWKVSDRVTVPFSMGCGTCIQCQQGDLQICDNYYQPGFKGWGSFAQLVALPLADINLVGLPNSIDFTTAASLGCRFATSYRAVTAQSALAAGQWLAVHGCGGVGLSAIMIAKALDCRVVAIDISDDALATAVSLGADGTVVATPGGQKSDANSSIVESIKQVTNGGAHVSIDALGSTETCCNSIACLRKRGRHVQVGLMTAQHSKPPIPFGQIISKELEIVGSHGMAATAYPQLLQLIESGRLAPQQLVSRTISLADVTTQLPRMAEHSNAGITVATEF